MKYKCYPDMGTADGEVEQIFTCTEYNGTYDYDGTEVKECNRKCRRVCVCVCVCVSKAEVDMSANYLVAYDDIKMNK